MVFVGIVVRFGFVDIKGEKNRCFDICGVWWEMVLVVGVMRLFGFEI